MRNQVKYTVSIKGRDEGKTYLITEFSADKGERFAAKVFFAILNAGIKLPENIEKTAMENIALIGFDAICAALSKVRYEDVEPIFNEMMEGIEFIPDITRLELSRKLLPDDIEEISTRLMLRKEVWKINTSFFEAVTGMNLSGSNHGKTETATT